ncbi:MAG: glutathione S-transferase N-terminal domain-containing protein [Woeseiaceae bacterium]
MKLYYSPTSPFVRKVNVFAKEVGLDKQIEWIKTNPWQVEDKLTAVNPLSQIPTLVTDNGEIIFDSNVICEYLDTLHENKKLIPDVGDKRWNALGLQALANGILESGISRFLERKRPAELQSSDWDKTQQKSIQRALNELERSVKDWGEDNNIATISIAITLGWLDFRFAEEDWRPEHKHLAQWFSVYSQRDSMLSTMPAEAS